MAANCLRAASRLHAARPYRSLQLCQRFSTSPPRHDSSETQPPPLLRALRQDLKDSMRAKNTNRLVVIRGLLADVTDASKTSSPIKNDLQLLALVRKRLAAGRAAAEEAGSVGRDDLREKEEGQVGVLEEYASKMQMWDEGQVRGVLGEVVKALTGTAAGKVSAGDVLKRVFGKGGELDGQPVERGRVAAIAKELLAGK